MEEDEEEDSELLVVRGGSGGHEGQFCLVTRWRSEDDFENTQNGQDGKVAVSTRSILVF
jgi:heme-degrading monooxygenase HmoA